MANRFRPARKNSSLVRAFSLAAFHVVVSPAVAHRRDAQESRSESLKMSLFIFFSQKVIYFFFVELGLRHPEIHLYIQTYVPFFYIFVHLLHLTIYTCWTYYILPFNITSLEDSTFKQFSLFQIYVSFFFYLQLFKGSFCWIMNLNKPNKLHLMFSSAAIKLNLGILAWNNHSE